LITLAEVRKRAEADAKTFGYYLIPDAELLTSFLEGLMTNENRYGYSVCPCRLASGNYDFDRDIICPCDYRDPDVAQYGACYCRLYVNKVVFESKNYPEVPERRPIEKQNRAYAPVASAQVSIQEKPSVLTQTGKATGEVKKKLWYCKQCGYVAFREDPPYVCPICKAKREVFAQIEGNFEFNG
jgi:ferredoxin-thioredoxin reductase catalytic chain